MPYVCNIDTPAIRKLLPFRNIRRVREIVNVMDKTSIDILQTKKAALQQGNETVLEQVGHGNDIMSIFCTCVDELSY
jgi:hypothetical protein